MDTPPILNSNTPTPRRSKKSSSRLRTPEARKAASSNASRLMILQNLVPIVINLLSTQLEAFSSRLAEELYRLSDQAVRPEEAKISLEAHQLVKRNNTIFYRLVSGQINAALSKEISIFNTKKRQNQDPAFFDNTSQTYEQMETRIVLRHVSQALELVNAEPLVMLNTLIGRILNRIPIDVSQNPFRPEIFVTAVHNAWLELDQDSESHLMVLKLLQPTVFIQLTPLYEEINQELMARGIRPDGKIVQEGMSGLQAFLPSHTAIAHNPYLQEKLKKIFSGEIDLVPMMAPDLYGTPIELGMSTIQANALDLAIAPTDLDKAGIDRQFFEDLLEMQRTSSQKNDVDEIDGSILRNLFKMRSASNLTVVERNSIELLARIFEFISTDQTLRDDIKSMIAQLQLSVLRVALVDIDFFFRESHPARMLMDILGSSGLILDSEADEQDPLLGVIGDVIEKVQCEFDQHIDLFSDVVSDLEVFLKEEEFKAQEAISEPVQLALSEEKMRIARELAEHDVAIRVETGEVAGFLEVFLQEHWIRILTLAHSVKDEKPNALENALKTMDDLIWSLKPKNSAEERKELIAKLPAMLTLLNAWLNAIRWDDPERVLFFSKLAERHASMARAPLELSPRRQLEIAVNIAQRASNRRLDRFVHGKALDADDEASKQVQTLERGMWLDFTNEDDHVFRFKLAWVSPKRTSFIFTNRQGYEAFSVSAEDLVAKCREGLVTNVVANSLVDRAMTFALRDVTS